MSRRLLAALVVLAVLAGAGTVYALNVRGESPEPGSAADAGPAGRPGLLPLPDQSPQELEARLGRRTSDVGLFTLGAQTVTADEDDELARGSAPKSVDTAGLLVARTDNGVPLGLAIAVRSSAAGAYPSVVDYTSTAFALLAQVPGFVSPDPKQMAVLRALAEGPELQALADQLESHAAADAEYLMSPKAQETQAFAALLKAVTAKLETTAGERPGSSTQPAAWSGARDEQPQRARPAPAVFLSAVPPIGGNDVVDCNQAVVADLDGKEGDGICLSVKDAGEDLLTAPGTGDVELDVVNHAGRWGLLYEQGSKVPLAVLPARAIDMPGVSKSLTKLAALQTQATVDLACRGLGLFGIKVCPVKGPDDGYLDRLRDQFDVFKEGKMSVSVSAADTDKNLMTYAPGRDVAGVEVPAGAAPLAAAANVVFIAVLPLLQVSLDLPAKFSPAKLPASFGRSQAGPGDGLQALLAISSAAQGELLQISAPGASASQRTSAFIGALEKTLADPSVLGKLLKALGWAGLDDIVDWGAKVAAKALIYAIPGPGWLKAAIDAGDKVIDVVGLFLNLNALGQAVKNDDAVDVYLPLRDPEAVRRAVTGEMSFAGTCFYGADPVHLEAGVGRATVSGYDDSDRYETLVDVATPQFLTAEGRTYAVVTTHCSQSNGPSEFETWAVHLVGVGEDGRAEVLDVTTTSDEEPAARVTGETVTMRISSAVAREQDTAVFEVEGGKLAWRGQTCADVLARARMHQPAILEFLQQEGAAGARVLEDGRLWLAWASAQTGDPISATYGRPGAEPEYLDGGGDSYAFVRAVSLFLEQGEIACAVAR